MKLFLNNITYHNCPVDVREKVAFGEVQRRLMLKKMQTKPAICEAAILETCNRVEFYVYAKENFNCSRFLKKLIEEVKPQAVDAWDKYSRKSEGLGAVRHLFEVAAGLDSQMIGENQILSQAKSAYAESVDCKMSKTLFHRLFHTAFRAGKAVRTDTHINCGAVSIALAAVELAKGKMDLSAATAMVIGAGENAELVARYLIKAGLSDLIIANRSIAGAKAVTGRLKKGKIMGLKCLNEKLTEVDLVISSTSAAKPLITYEAAESVLKHRTKPLLIIDIAVPRDIDPDIAECKCVRLYNIDDLKEQINICKEKRNREIPKAMAIVDEFTNKFADWLNALNVMPMNKTFFYTG
jgi:glutamyl-tRNA reductase